jgi:hypothetical protein
MVKGKDIGILFMVLMAALLFFGRTQASAYDSPDGQCTATELANYPGECVEVFDANGDLWGVVEVVPDGEGHFPVYYSAADRACYTKPGQYVECSKFEYRITAFRADATLSQVNLLIPAGAMTLVMKDNSVKIREYEPSTGFGKFSTDDVITWDSLKLDPSNQARIVALTSPAGRRMTQMELADGPIYADPILGPDRCSETQAKGEITVQSGQEGTPTTATFDLCTGDLTGVFSGADANDANSLQPLQTDVWACFDDPDISGILDYCSKIKKIGPETGAFFDVSADTGSPGDPYVGTRIFGWGNTFYKQTGVTGTFPASCAEDTGALVEQKIIFDKKVKVSYNECGDTISATVDGNELIEGTLYVFESNRDPRKVNWELPLDWYRVVNAGPRHGALMNGSTYDSFGGWYGYWPW